MSTKLWLGEADEIKGLCSSTKVEISKFRESLNECKRYKDKEKLLIWDFYVSQYVQGRFVGIDQKKIPVLVKRLMNVGGVEFFRAIRTKKIDNTLKRTDLSEPSLCPEHPRIVLTRKFSLTSDENEKLSFTGGNAENELSCLLRHIRNSLAHNNTYFFKTGNMLLEDRDGNAISARILIGQKTLIDWIELLKQANIVFMGD